MSETKMTITPQIAEVFLEKNTKNRPIRNNRVAQYARDIKSGHWGYSTDPIAFFRDGTLANGQHRLMAIIKAETPAVMKVEYDVPDDAVFDRGHGRSALDIIHFNDQIPDNLKNNVCSILINNLFRKSGLGVITDSERIQFIKDYPEALSDTVTLVQTGGANKICKKAGVSVAVFLALVSGEQYDDLKSFLSCVNSGFTTGMEQSSAIVLRNYIYSHPAGGSAAINALENVTEQAIWDFCRRIPRKRKYDSEASGNYWKLCAKMGVAGIEKKE